MTKSALYHCLSLLPLLIISVSLWIPDGYGQLLGILCWMHYGILVLFAGKYAPHAWLADTVVAMYLVMSLRVYPRYYVFIGWAAIAFGFFLLVMTLVGPDPLAISLSWPMALLAAAGWLGIIALLLHLGLQQK